MIHWNKKRIDMLVRMWRSGLPTRDIANYFKTTPENIMGRICVLRGKGVDLQKRLCRHGPVDVEALNAIQPEPIMPTAEAVLREAMADVEQQGGRRPAWYDVAAALFGE